MVDTSSIEALIASLPTMPRTVERLLLLKMRLPEAVPPSVASLAQRGYLGCLPFAHHKGDEIVLRLLPGEALSDATVGVAWWSITEGMTIAPDLSRFVAGRLAQIDIGKPGKEISEKNRDQLLEFASQFGNASSVASVLETVETVRPIEKAAIRQGKLWGAACPDHPVCKALAGAWTHRWEDVGDWLSRVMPELSGVDIVQRLYVSHHEIFNTGVDVTEAAWKLVRGDDVFDPTYTGVMHGPALGAWDVEALIQAIKWLKSQAQLDPVQERSDLWEAAKIYDNGPKTYDGAMHLSAAIKLAAEAPTLAYTHAANAAAFYARAVKETPVEAILFAHELAVANGWEEIRITLDWARRELKI